MAEDCKTCPDCAETVRAAARKCRFCGFRFDGESAVAEDSDNETRLEGEKASPLAVEESRNNQAIRNGVWIVGAVLILIVVIAVINSASETDRLISDVNSRTAENDALLESLGLDEEGNPSGGGGWSYNTERDELRGRDIKIARLSSENVVYFGSPYDGGSTGQVYIRQHPEWGLDVYFVVQPSQMLCDFRGCQGMINFDGDAERLSLLEPSSHDSTTVFSQYPEAILSKIQNAERMIVELSFFQEGNQQFTFDVGELEWPIETAREDTDGDNAPSL